MSERGFNGEYGVLEVIYITNVCIWLSSDCMLWSAQVQLSSVCLHTRPDEIHSDSLFSAQFWVIWAFHWTAVGQEDKQIST